MTTLIVSGIGGRMGRRVAALAREAGGDFTVAAGLERAGHPLVGGNLDGVPVFADPRQAARAAMAGLEGRAVVIDFSSPAALAGLARAAAVERLALVSGTTGLDEPAGSALDEAARAVPVVWSPNMSLGVNLLFRLAALAAKALPAADVEIVETHHRHKLDAPSGTARRLADLVAAARGGAGLVHGREGLAAAERSRAEIGLHSVRMGEVAGEHEVHFALEHEIVTLTHRAQSRDAFVTGALAAARFAAAAAPGRYGMEDVLGL